MIKNKDEIKAYYQTHDISIKDCAALFDVSYRTLAHWIKSEGWEKLQAITSPQTLNTQIVQENLNEVLQVSKVKLKKELRSQLGYSGLDERTLHKVLDSSSEALILKALSVNFINANIAQAAILAKDELLKYNDARLVSDKPDPMFIACAEKVAKIFVDMKTTMYGKNVVIDSAQENDLENLSTQELLRIINEN